MTDTISKPENDSNPLADVVEWDYGTAYEMLNSFHTILRPKDHGMPAPWAAGVRKRLSQHSQLDLKQFFGLPFGYIGYTPMHLINQMQQPKDVKHFLELLESIPDEEFSRKLHMPLTDDNLARITDKAVSGKTITDADVEEYRRVLTGLGVRSVPSATEMRRVLIEMSDPVNVKARYLTLLREYQAVFFAEEEKRAKPVLEKMLANAQKLAKKATIPDLLDRLSNGFTLSPNIDLKRLVIAPSIWLHPFALRYDLGDRELFVSWSAHPDGYRLVPGEIVPDDALLVLRALGDPTRLRLLRLLNAEPRSPQSLAIELKLSLPTVSHHMRELRVAGLIRIEVAGKGRESRYTVRWPSAQRAFTQLEEFVQGQQ